MATLAMETSNCSCEGCIVAWRFTKRQPGGRGDYWVLSLSGNCWRAAKNIVKTDEKYRFFGDLLAAALVKRVSTRIPEGVPTVVVEVREKINDTALGK
jgi:hypothetical protein